MDVHIRKYAQEFVVDPVVETGIYASGDLLCAKITLNPIWNETYIEKITVVDLASQDAAFDFVFFSTDPSATTFTVNSALDIADADCDRITATAQVLAAHYIDFADNSVACVNDYIFLKGHNSNLYIAVIVRGTPTYVATGDIRFKFEVIKA